LGEDALKPNILLLFSDQQRFDALGAVNPKIRTPNLDRLARGGTLFERAYAPTPVCLPCRASLLTGQYSSTHGAAHNAAQLPQEYPNLLSATLRTHGYATHIIGKSHFSPCHDPLSLESAPHIHDLDYFRNWHGPWFGFEHAAINIGHTTEAHACGEHYGAWLEDRGVDLARYFGNTAYTAYGAWDLPEEFHSSKWVADTTIAAIDRSQENDEPFFIWANFQDPHNPCMVPEPWASRYSPDEIPHFGFKPGEPESFATKPSHYQEILDQPGSYACRPSDPLLPGTSNISHLDYTPRQTQANAACYYGMVELMDHHIGRILDALEANGQLGNTVIVFASDHGDCLGDHGLWWKGAVAFEEAIRVPMIAHWPGHIPAGRMCDGFQSLIDLFPTFCVTAGAPIPIACQGVNQLPCWTGETESVRENVVVEERPYDTAWCQRILINDDYKLVFYANRDSGELYDMRTDRDHVRNLWEVPEFAGVKAGMIHRLASLEFSRVHPTLGPSAALARQRQD